MEPRLVQGLLYARAMRTRISILVVVLLAAFGASASAGKKAKQVRFVSGHPIPDGEGGGFCHIEAPHVHAYVPTDVKLQYRVVGDDYFFIGDPVAYGWEGEHYSYYGHHPVAVNVVIGEPGEDTEYCYLDGPHYHAYAPPADLEFELKSDAYWYVGDPAPAYVEARATLDPIDVVYEPIVYERPAVVVASAPAAWIGLVVVAPVPVVEVVTPVPVKKVKARAEVGVEVIVPSVSIEIGVGGHYHGHPPGKHKGWHKGKRGRRH